MKLRVLQLMRSIGVGKAMTANVLQVALVATLTDKIN